MTSTNHIAYAERHYHPGDVIFRQGDTASEAYIVESGTVEICTKDGTVIAVLGQNSLFGELAVLDGGVRTATAKARAPTVLLSIPQHVIREALSMTTPMISAIVSDMTTRYRNMLDGEPPASPSDIDWIPPPHGEKGHTEVLRQFRSAFELQSALRGHELSLNFQPICSMTEGRIRGFEALTRWYHATEGWIPPATFIRDAEKSGLIIELGYWVLRNACSAFSRLPDAEDLFVSINLSPKQFDDRRLLANVGDILEEQNINPRRIKIELTEGTLMRDPETARQVLCGFKDMGLSVVLDDFGVGYSSLGYLHRFPIDVIKIDRSITNEICTSIRCAKLVEAILAMARSLSLKVVSEGVETHEQRRWLNDRGCDYEQGYLAGAPMTEADLLAKYSSSVPSLTGSGTLHSTRYEEVEG